MEIMAHASCVKFPRKRIPLRAQCPLRFRKLCICRFQSPPKVINQRLLATFARLTKHAATFCGAPARFFRGRTTVTSRGSGEGTSNASTKCSSHRFILQHFDKIYMYTYCLFTRCPRNLGPETHGPNRCVQRRLWACSATFNDSLVIVTLSSRGYNV